MNVGPKALRQTITLRPLAPDRGDDSLNNQDGEVPGSILQYTWNRNNNDDTRHQYRVEVTAHCELFENASKWLRMDNQVLLGYSDLDHELDQTSYATDPSGFNYKAPNDLSPLRFATQGDGSARVPLFLKNTSRTTNQNKAIYASHQGRFLDDRVNLLLGAPRFDPTRDIVYNVSNFSPSQAPGGSNGGSAKLDTGAAYAAWESGVGSGAIFQSTEGNGALTWYVNASRPEGAAFLDAAFAANQADFGSAWLDFLYQGESGDSLVNNATMDTMAFHGNGSNNAALLLTDESEGYDAQVLIKVLKNFEMILNGAITEVNGSSLANGWPTRTWRMLGRCGTSRMVRVGCSACVRIRSDLRHAGHGDLGSGNRNTHQRGSGCRRRQPEVPLRFLGQLSLRRRAPGFLRWTGLLVHRP